MPRAFALSAICPISVISVSSATGGNAIPSFSVPTVLYAFSVAISGTNILSKNVCASHGMLFTSAKYAVFMSEGVLFPRGGADFGFICFSAASVSSSPSHAPRRRAFIRATLMRSPSSILTFIFSGFAKNGVPPSFASDSRTRSGLIELSADSGTSPVAENVTLFPKKIPLAVTVATCPERISAQSEISAFLSGIAAPESFALSFLSSAVRTPSISLPIFPV